MSKLLYFGPELMGALKTTLGNTVDGADITGKKIEGDPLIYFASEDTAPATPVVVLDPEAFPMIEEEQLSAKKLLQTYVCGIYLVDSIPLVANQNIFERVRNRTQILAERIANSQTLGLGTQLSDGLSIIDRVQVTRVDNRPPEYLWLRERGQRKVIGKFTAQIRVAAYYVQTREVNAIP